MNLYVGCHNKENYFVKASNEKIAEMKLRRRLFEKFGTCNLTDFRFVRKVEVREENESSTRGVREISERRAAN